MESDLRHAYREPEVYAGDMPHASYSMMTSGGMQCDDGLQGMSYIQGDAGYMSKQLDWTTGTACPDEASETYWMQPMMHQVFAGDVTHASYGMMTQGSGLCEDGMYGIAFAQGNAGYMSKQLDWTTGTACPDEASETYWMQTPMMHQVPIRDTFVRSPPRLEHPEAMSSEMQQIRENLQKLRRLQERDEKALFGGRRDGKGRFEWPDGTVYDGEWRSDTVEGEGAFKRKVQAEGGGGQEARRLSQEAVQAAPDAQPGEVAGAKPGDVKCHRVLVDFVPHSRDYGEMPIAAGEEVTVRYPPSEDWIFGRKDWPEHDEGWIPAQCLGIGISLDEDDVQAAEDRRSGSSQPSSAMPTLPNEAGKKHGRDVFVYADGAVFKADWQEDALDGVSVQNMAPSSGKSPVEEAEKEKEDAEKWHQHGNWWSKQRHLKTAQETNDAPRRPANPDQFQARIAARAFAAATANQSKS